MDVPSFIHKTKKNGVAQGRRSTTPFFFREPQQGGKGSVQLIFSSREEVTAEFLSLNVKIAFFNELRSADYAKPLCIPCMPEN
jgi:hypothetical protein